MSFCFPVSFSILKRIVNIICIIKEKLLYNCVNLTVKVFEENGSDQNRMVVDMGERGLNFLLFFLDVINE